MYKDVKSSFAREPCVSDAGNTEGGGVLKPESTGWRIRAETCLSFLNLALSFALFRSEQPTEGVDYIYAMKFSARAVVLLSLATSSLATYDLVKTYSGNSFFDSWSYYGYYDNFTSGVQLSLHLAFLVELRA